MNHVLSYGRLNRKMYRCAARADDPLLYLFTVLSTSVTQGVRCQLYLVSCNSRFGEKWSSNQHAPVEFSMYDVVHATFCLVPQRALTILSSTPVLFSCGTCSNHVIASDFVCFTSAAFRRESWSRYFSVSCFNVQAPLAISVEFHRLFPN